MNDTPTTPRRSMVPGPSGIAAKAIAVREQAAERETIRRPDGDQLLRAKGPPLPSPLPVTTVGELAKGIAGVMSEVGTIQKTGFNKFHNYHYATLQDLLFAITPLMGKHGVVVMQNEVERSAVETRIMVTYEFSIFHTSGEVWPDRPRFTGMAIGRDSKGNWDDKAINKCHSAARKYFLLSLFQVPSGDFDDADAGPAHQPQASTQPERSQRPRTVPGPANIPQQPVADKRLPLEGGPYKITLPQGSGADQWAKAYIDAIKKAETEQQLAQWDELNGSTLQMLSEKFPDVYKQIDDAFTQRILEVAPETAMPDPKNDTQEAMQWVAQQLADTTTYEQAETLWNKAIAPHEGEFDPSDWELLMNEWRRVELRLNPDPDEPEAA